MPLVAPSRKFRIGFDARMVYYRQAGIGHYILNLLGELVALQYSQSQPADFELVVLQSRREKRSPSQWLFDNPTSVENSSSGRLPLPTPKIQNRQVWTPPHHRLEQLVLPFETALANVDVLHSPDFVPPLVRQRFQVGRLRHFGSVITIHDLAFLKFPYLLTVESRRYYGQVKRAAQSAERIIAVSHATARDIESELEIEPAKIRVVYEAANPVFQPLNPPNLDTLAQRLPALMAKLAAAGMSPATPFILFVSTLEPRKNLPTLLQALRRVLDNLLPAAEKPVLVIAGREGWLYEDVYKLATELNLRANRELVWLGGVSTEELLWLYNRAACLALPSLYEGFGLPPLEALACGTPVLVANTSSLPEVVGAHGTLIAPQDLGAWAAALETFWVTRGLRKAQTREEGPTWAKNFSWQRAATETLAVYKEALRR